MAEQEKKPCGCRGVAAIIIAVLTILIMRGSEQNITDLGTRHRRPSPPRSATLASKPRPESNTVEGYLLLIKGPDG